MQGFSQKIKHIMRDLPAFAMRSRRRGSFLVLVVGTLAMLSIIMIVYVAVGSSDKRASASLERRNRSDEIITLFSDYVAQIIADDAVAVAPDPSNTDPATNTPRNLAGGNLFVRESWDAPVTDWFVNSTITDPKDPRYFRPTGAGDDPWLASTTPTWINFDPASSGLSFTGADGDKKTFTKRRDWLHISNISPDGRFVNLFNLRDNFDAKPGTSTTLGDLHMHGQLSLTDQANAVRAQTAWKQAVGSEATATSTYQNPAIFDSWQVGAFRPARGPFANIQPDKPEYPPYQWADADGDGFFDSRWFEMVDARDPNQTGGPSSPQFFRNLLPTDPNYRWVFAARIIDLSSLVNVNTAGDSNADPNASWTNNPASAAGVKGDVIGLSPADIDLRRLLTMRDTTESLLNGSALGAFQIDSVGAFNGGYSGLPLPPGGKPLSQNYFGYDDQPVAPRTYGKTYDLGWGAYESLRATLNVGRPPGRFSDFTQAPLKEAKNSFATFADRGEFYRKAAPAVARPAYRANIPFNPSDPANTDPSQLFLSGSGGIAPTVTGAIDYGLGFRLSNLLELLTFRSVNDPNVSSSLESALGGKFQSNFATAPTAAILDQLGESFGPLRENRSLELERENLAITTGGNAGQPTEAAMLKSYADIRQYLTTLSGARPIVSSAVSASNIDQPPALSDSELSIFVGSNPSAAQLFRRYADALLPGMAFYRPEAPAVEIWKDPATDTTSKQLRGMFYGGQGPITALLAAGHMAANFASSAQPQDGTASRAPYVLVMAEPVYKDAAASLPQDTLVYTDWKKYFPSWWSSSDRRLNLARLNAGETNGARLSVKKEAPLPAPAVNIYGMGDPHPFLTEVATFTVYRDVPIQAGSKIFTGADFETIPATTRPPGSNISQVTINGDVTKKTNQDLMFRVLAVKVHNPYPQAIALSSGGSQFGSSFSVSSGAQFTANSIDNFFYIRVGTGAEASYFVLADVEEEKSGDEYSGNYRVQPLTIRPNETIVFYALNCDSKFIVEERLNPTDRESALTNPVSPKYLEEWLEKQLGPVSKSAANPAREFRRIKMLRADSAFDDAGAPPNSRATFEFTKLLPEYSTDQTVHLFRSVRTDSGATVGNDSALSTANVVGNDRLCDRIRLTVPGASTSEIVLDQRLRASTGINGIPVLEMYVDSRPDLIKYQDPRDATNLTDGTPNYNNRVTVTVSAHVRRKGDPSGAAFAAGMIPAWAIDPKDEAPSTWYDHETGPVANSKQPYQLTMATADLNLGANARFTARFPKDWRALGPVYPTLPQFVNEWPSDMGKNKANQDFVDLRRELVTNANLFQGYKADYTPNGVSQIRPTDLLNVMAIGSTHVPVDINGSELNNGAEPDLMKQWTTTAEALAIAMGYADRTKYDYANGQTAFGPLAYYYFGPPTSNPAVSKPLFDSGYLKLDDYAAVRYDASDKPFSAGSGAPIAGNVLSMFRAHPDSFANINIATPGLVNINTAPQAVLRVLPLTFPSTNELIDATKGQAKSTFWTGPDESKRAENALKTDIAAMIESYRDKIAVELRPKAKVPAAASGPTWFAGFFDRTKDAFTTANAQDADPNDPLIGDYSQLPTYKGGRYWSTGIKGIREGAGFRSVGELLAVKHIEFDPATGLTTTTPTDLETRTSNIDFLGFSSTPTNMLGTDNIVERVLDTTDPANPKTTDIRPLQFGKTYQDKLKILSGLLGSVSVRSDMYAVWFIARGYQRSDVEGLPALQPMVPSVERRFLMIIDRSNVTKVGQKPRVLAFVELPL